MTRHQQWQDVEGHQLVSIDALSNLQSALLLRSTVSSKVQRTRLWPRSLQLPASSQIRDYYSCLPRKKLSVQLAQYIRRQTPVGSQLWPGQPNVGTGTHEERHSA